MDAGSYNTNITQSLHRTVLAGCLPSSLSTTPPGENGEVEANLPESVDDNSQPTPIENKIHILISDQDGITLFDSDSYIQSLHVDVFDQNGKLLYSSREHSRHRNSHSQAHLKLYQKKTRRIKSGKRKKKNAVNIHGCAEECSDIPPRDRKRANKLQITKIPYVAIERLKSIKDHVTDITSDTNIVNLNSITETYIEDISTSIPQDTSSDNDLGNVSLGIKIERHSEGSSTGNANIESNSCSHVSVDVVGERTENTPGPSGTEHETDLTGAAEALTCNICGITYKSQMMLNRHKEVHELEHTDVENPLQCPICQKVYPNWRSLTIHRRKHDAAKENVCEKCGKGFRTKQELIRHEFVHSSAKSSPCHVCGKLFKNKAYAQMHSKLHSAENRKHICKLCGKNFLRGPDIQKHMRIHTGEKPFICSQCGRSFSESSHLIRHERLHTGEKPYKCESCDLRFTHKEVMIRHTFTHMEHLPFSCEVCNKGFKTKRELDNHWLIHDKPTDPALKEVCQICGKTFSHVLYLRYHMRTHNNLGIFQCTVCAKVFKKASYLRQHTINQHADPAVALEPDCGLQTNNINPEFIGASVKSVIEPINCDIDGISSEHYTYMSTEISNLLLSQKN